MTVYEATQEQRRIERTIRQYKRREAAHKTAGQNEAASAAGGKMREWQKRARDLTKQTGLKRDYAREQI